LVAAMLLGADRIDGCDVLRTGRVLGHRVMAPSTLGTFLRVRTTTCVGPTVTVAIPLNVATGRWRDGSPVAGLPAMVEPVHWSTCGKSWVVGMGMPR